MNYKRLITSTAAASAVVAITAFALFRFDPQKVEAFNPQPDPPGFGIVGITDGQILRVNVVNTALPPDPIAPPNPARVVITFRDANGVLMTNANGVVIRRVVQLQGGESTFLQLNADNFTRESNGRLQLRPDVRIQRPDPIVTAEGALPPDPIIPTVEVINSTNGKTQFVLPAVTVGYTGNHNETLVRDPSLR